MSSSPVAVGSVGLALGSMAPDFQLKGVDDETQEIARKYGAICTPHIFLFNQQRVLSYKGRIDDNRNPTDVKSHDLRNAIDSVLSGKTPAVQETRPFGCSIKWKH